MACVSRRYLEAFGGFCEFEEFLGVEIAELEVEAVLDEQCEQLDVVGLDGEFDGEAAVFAGTVEALAEQLVVEGGQLLEVAASEECFEVPQLLLLQRLSGFGLGRC